MGASLTKCLLYKVGGNYVIKFHVFMNDVVATKKLVAI